MNAQVAGVVLAGGRGSRMGANPKVLMRLDGLSLVERARRRAVPQVGVLCISSHLGAERLGHPDCIVLPDSIPGFRGPLAGVCSAMEYFRTTAPAVEWLCSFAADTPWFPRDLVARLLEALTAAEGADMAVARSAGREHPVFALWPMTALPRLRSAVEAGTDLSMGRFQSGFRVAWADWPAGELDPFFNLNTPEDVAVASARLREAGDRGSGIR
jgi:molybdopterin-guanine dinucleotide biosynthesis protein A